MRTQKVLLRRNLHATDPEPQARRAFYCVNVLSRSQETVKRNVPDDGRPWIETTCQLTL
jgi:hypothetical protein